MRAGRQQKATTSAISAGSVTAQAGALATRRRRFGQVRPPTLKALPQLCGVGCPRRDRVDANVGTEVERRRANPAFQRRLGRGIGGDAARGRTCVHAADHHHSTALSRHALTKRAGKHVGRKDVHAQGLDPVGDRCLANGADRLHRGVVHQGADRVVVSELSCNREQRLGVGHVDLTIV